MPRTSKTEKTISEQKDAKKNYVFAVGRRREAIARVRLYKPQNSVVTINGKEYHKGDVIVNGKSVRSYFNFKGYASYFTEFFELTHALEKFVFSTKVVGGGIKGQLDAMLLGISRALDRYDREAYHSLLKQKGYLTRDARTRERRKVGMGGKARRKKQSPKR